MRTRFVRIWTSFSAPPAIFADLDLTSQLATDGYTVTRSARVDNGDGSYTWTYTVAPVSL